MENLINFEAIPKDSAAYTQLIEMIMTSDDVTHAEAIEVIESKDRNELYGYLEEIFDAAELLYFRLSWSNHNNDDEFSIYKWGSKFYLKHYGCCGNDISGPYDTAESIISKEDGYFSGIFAEDDTTHRLYVEGCGVNIGMEGTLCDSDPIKAHEFYTKITHRE